MKKSFITPFAMMLFMAFTFTFTLTSCGEEVEKTSTGPTEFISENDGTRTSIDDERYFYWEPGDNIWINTSGTTWVRSDDNTITGNAQGTCKFIFSNTFTAAGYPVMYTGNDTTSTSATEVKIAPVQKQKSWNNAEHFGASGDCGTATAAKQDNGTYKFTLRHKAAYLKLQPYYDNGSLTGLYTLSKIEITTRKNTTTLSGTYDFTHANGLAATPKTSAESDTIVTLICGDNGFQLGTAAVNSCFVVIHPNIAGEQHAINIKYYVNVTDGPYNGSEFEFERVVTAKEYKPNGVTTIAHQFSAGEALPTYEPHFYMWDAPIGGDWYSGMADNYNTVYVSAGSTFTATRSCALMPNVNEAYWYVMYGDPRWDGTTRWKIKNDPNIYTGGVWILYKRYIGIFNSNKIADGRDMRKEVATNFAANNSTTYQTGGMPPIGATVTYTYFFVPALGGAPGQTPGGGGIYYTSTPAFTGASATATQYAYRIWFTPSGIGINNGSRDNPRLGATRLDGTPWFL